jgi:hypothetical protein
MDPPAMIDYIIELTGNPTGVDAIVGDFARRRGRLVRTQ